MVFAWTISLHSTGLCPKRIKYLLCPEAMRGGGDEVIQAGYSETKIWFQPVESYPEVEPEPIIKIIQCSINAQNSSDVLLK